MGRLVFAIVSLGALGYLAFQLFGGSRSAGTPPAERLENVRNAGKQIEADSQKAADEALKKADEGVTN